MLRSKTRTATGDNSRFHVRAAVLRPPDPKFALRVPRPALGTERRAAHKSNHRTPPAVRSRSRRCRSRRSDAVRGAAGSGVRRREGLSSDDQEYNPTPIINEVRHYVETWRNLPNPTSGRSRPRRPGCCSTGGTTRSSSRAPVLLPDRGGGDGDLADRGGAEVAPRAGKFWTHIKGANDDANPELVRIALKLATGAGKTTVMAMLIAWQTVNAVRHPSSKQFSRGFLIVTPGHHDQGPAARAPAERPGELLPRAASSCRPTCSATSSTRRSSSPTITPSGSRETMDISKAARAPPGRGGPTQDARDRRPDAAARHAAS